MGNHCCACQDAKSIGAVSDDLMTQKLLRLTFLTDEEKEVTVFFRKAPLGFRLAYKQAPLKVANINDHGCVKEDGLDVQPGWVLSAVNGVSLTNLHQKVGAQIVKDAIKDTFGDDREADSTFARGSLSQAVYRSAHGPLLVCIARVVGRLEQLSAHVLA
eukprot:CAMPEP_0181454390 /NCGR_PEP_ID=MMETSP1110-20121109/30212_1 /TAXON_ID=174948 /ORGANISM="Symbiodinium sp., Strain CCMP421" /LENGTH=158 /DNA_ID=CAMNT_0023578731 /DNA_START=38 /DNA_END=511 /DNA_ORIENTATION=-